MPVARPTQIKRSPRVVRRKIKAQKSNTARPMSVEMKEKYLRPVLNMFGGIKGKYDEFMEEFGKLGRR